MPRPRKKSTTKKGPIDNKPKSITAKTKATKSTGVKPTRGTGPLHNIKTFMKPVTFLRKTSKGLAPVKSSDGGLKQASCINRMLSIVPVVADTQIGNRYRNAKTLKNGIPTRGDKSIETTKKGVPQQVRTNIKDIVDNPNIDPVIKQLAIEAHKKGTEYGLTGQADDWVTNYRGILTPGNHQPIDTFLGRTYNIKQKFNSLWDNYLKAVSIEAKNKAGDKTLVVKAKDKKKALEKNPNANLTTEGEVKKKFLSIPANAEKYGINLGDIWQDALNAVLKGECDRLTGEPFERQALAGVRKAGKILGKSIGNNSLNATDYQNKFRVVKLGDQILGAAGYGIPSDRRTAVEEVAKAAKETMRRNRDNTYFNQAIIEAGILSELAKIGVNPLRETPNKALEKKYTELWQNKHGASALGQRQRDEAIVDALFAAIPKKQRETIDTTKYQGNNELKQLFMQQIAARPEVYRLWDEKVADVKIKKQKLNKGRQTKLLEAKANKRDNFYKAKKK